MTIAWRQIGIAAGVSALLAGGLAWRLHRPAVQTTTTTDTHADSSTTAHGSTTTVQQQGPVTIRREKTKPTPQGPVVTVTTVEHAPVTTTTTSSASVQTVEKVRVETRTVTVERPPSWYRLSAEAGWKPLDLRPVPSAVELEASAHVFGPLWLGAKVEGDPSRIRDTAAVTATVRAEWP